ncbi:hypothetical protein K438DRAFT_1608158, partial [Mycena galopus ATCC 62051]
TVDEVVDWLESKGFDEEVRNKFSSKSNFPGLDIAGDALLTLDVDVLKTELNVTAYGKRFLIANAIKDLCRPPSPSGDW